MIEKRDPRTIYEKMMEARKTDSFNVTDNVSKAYAMMLKSQIAERQAEAAYLATMTKVYEDEGGNKLWATFLDAVNHCVDDGNEQLLKMAARYVEGDDTERRIINQTLLAICGFELASLFRMTTTDAGELEARLPEEDPPID